MSKFRVIIFIEEYSDILRDKILHLLSNKNPKDVEFWSTSEALDVELSKKGFVEELSCSKDNVDYMIVQENVLIKTSYWYINYESYKHLKTRIIKNEF